MLRASGPERRTTPMPPRPGGVAMATMVSSRCIGEIIHDRECTGTARIRRRKTRRPVQAQQSKELGDSAKPVYLWGDECMPEGVLQEARAAADHCEEQHKREDH